MFASSSEEPRHRSGFSLWLAAALALVVGIGLGFASGYRAGKSASTVAAPRDEKPAPTSGAGGRTFSESSVSEPVNLNSAPIEGEPVPQPKPAAEPAPPLKPAGSREPGSGNRQPAPAAVGRVPPRTQAVAADPPAPFTPPATGPGTLQVVSRPDGAQVVLDGRAVGKTPLTILDVAPGAHSIRLDLPGFKRWATTSDVKAGSATRVAASLEQ